MSDAAAIDFKPSQVDLNGSFPPLVGTFKNAEAEACASWMVRVCALDGDVWRPVAWKDIGARVTADMGSNAEPWARLARNPFLVPDVHRLVEDGFVQWLGTPGDSAAQFTAKGFDALRKWVRS